MEVEAGSHLKPRDMSGVGLLVRERGGGITIIKEVANQREREVTIIN